MLFTPSSAKVPASEFSHLKAREKEISTLRIKSFSSSKMEISLHHPSKHGLRFHFVISSLGEMARESLLDWAIEGWQYGLVGAVTEGSNSCLTWIGFYTSVEVQSIGPFQWWAPSN